MESMLQGEDHSNLLSDIMSAAPLSGERVQVLRYISTTVDGTYDGKANTLNRNAVSCLMRVHEVTAKDILDAGGVFVAGDLVTDSVVKVIGYNNQADAHQRTGDQLMYRGQKYMVVGLPRQVPGLGGRVFTKAHWRKI